jgi:hypothetical protein
MLLMLNLQTSGTVTNMETKQLEVSVGILMLVVVALVAVVLQLLEAIDILANLTDIFVWIAAAVISIAIGLIFRGSSAPKQELKPPEKREATQPASSIPIRSGGIIAPKGGEPLMVTVIGSGLEVYTRAEVEEKYPFDRFVSQVKHGGELVIMVGAFSVLRYKTDTIKRLITEKNVTVTILLLAPTIKKTVPAFVPSIKKVLDAEIDIIYQIERDFKWQNLIADIQQTLILLCKLRIELKELKNHLIVRAYDRTPTLSMIVIDPNTEGAIMQVGTLLSGTDASARFQIILSKKTKPEVFGKYWDEYLLIRDKHSHTIDYKQIEGEFLS